MSEPLPTLAEVLRQYMWRERTPPISANKLAKELRLSRQTVANWMNGATRPADAQIAPLAEKLGRPESYLRRVIYGVHDEPAGTPPDELSAALAALPPEVRERALWMLNLPPDELQRALARMDAFVERAHAARAPIPLPTTPERVEVGQEAEEEDRPKRRAGAR